MSDKYLAVFEVCETGIIDVTSVPQISFPLCVLVLPNNNSGGSYTSVLLFDEYVT